MSPPSDFQKMFEKIEYLMANPENTKITDIFPNGIPEEMYYFYLNNGQEKLKEMFGGMPPELKERYPNGLPEEVKSLFRGKKPAEIIQMFKNGVPQPLKDLFPEGVPESLKQRYKKFPEEFKALLKP
ncbi:hypothetical protein BCR36DRAFT_32460 [Piromyces finnis]|uniref:Uncharacterized protein n=1 Tax=Piromyces finnis TaxID=1754191 RepID=A0A1Y1VDA5_9FUNG|nr:hypothetical protein BCR36DRAFT_32460 [Piromyces finnis]|eukprot:ORX52638.1 hypothetical protein BCR36DRAFT_32460 [Piromyces finnis]